MKLIKCGNCDEGFMKLVKECEKQVLYYCEHCKQYKICDKVEKPKRFVATTSRGLYCWDNVTGKRYDAVDDFYDMMDLLNALYEALTLAGEETQQLKQSAQETEDLCGELKKVNEMLQMDLAMTERNLMEENEKLKKELVTSKVVLEHLQEEYSKLLERSGV